MRIAVAGATGNIGARTVSVLERDGHAAVRISRSLGVDLITGVANRLKRLGAHRKLIAAHTKLLMELS